MKTKIPLRKILYLPDDPAQAAELQKQIQEAGAAQKAISEGMRALTDRFVEALIGLVYAELHVRPLRVRKKGGIRKGQKLKSFPCPLCGKRPNLRKKWGYICRVCSAGQQMPYRKTDPGPKHTPKTNLQSVLEYQARKKKKLNEYKAKANKERARLRLARLAGALAAPEAEPSPATDEFVDTVLNVANSSASESTAAKPNPPSKAKWDIFNE
jgi:hypothetical protein